MELKTCTSCTTEKPLEAFAKNKKKKDGHSYVCRECQNIYGRQHYLHNRRKYIDKSLRRKQDAVVFLADYKSGKKCPYCPETDPICFDFHHRDPANKSADICTLANSGCAISTLMAEIKKCILLCVNCHRKFHAGRLEL